MNIAIAGKAGSGKSTAAKQLARQHGYQIVSIAAKLKEVCALHPAVLAGDERALGALRQHVADVLPIDAERVLPQVVAAFREIPVSQCKPRKLLQVVGSVIRAAKHDAWVSYLMRNAASLGLVVVDDVRFRDEFDAFTDAGWLTVYCAVPAVIREQRLIADYGKPLSQAEKRHPSECDLDGVPIDAWGYVLNAAVSMESERHQVDEMIATMGVHYG